MPKTWPDGATVDPTLLDSLSDNFDRNVLHKMALAVVAMIEARGAAGRGDEGIASLTNGRVPDAQTGRGLAGGVAELNNAQTPTVPASRLPAATADLAGAVELATAAETIAGADAARAVTPAALAGRAATASRTGLVELATAAETVAGTDATRAVTPAALAGAYPAPDAMVSVIGSRNLSASDAGKLLHLTRGADLSIASDVWGEGDRCWLSAYAYGGGADESKLNRSGGNIVLTGISGYLNAVRTAAAPEPSGFVLAKARGDGREMSIHTLVRTGANVYHLIPGAWR